MARHWLPSGLLALCLVLTSLAAGMAQTRMAAAGGFCAGGTPWILLDADGLPVLDGNGAAVSAPDCPICHLTVARGADALSVPTRQEGPGLTLAAAAVSVPPCLSVRLVPQARAPPVLA